MTEHRTSEETAGDVNPRDFWTAEELMVLVDVNNRVDTFINDSIGAMQAHAYAVRGAHLMQGLQDGDVELHVPDDHPLSMYIDADDHSDDIDIDDGLRAMRRLMLLAHWSALQDFADNVLLDVAPTKTAARRTRKRVREQHEANPDRAGGVAAYEDWFTYLGYPSALTPEHDELLRHVARLRNSIAHGGDRPTRDYLRQAPPSWQLDADEPLSIPDPALSAALNAVALYVAYLGERITGAPHDFPSNRPDLLLDAFLHPHDE